MILGIGWVLGKEDCFSKTFRGVRPGNSPLLHLYTSGTQSYSRVPGLMNGVCELGTGKVWGICKRETSLLPQFFQNIHAHRNVLLLTSSLPRDPSSNPQQSPWGFLPELRLLATCSLYSGLGS